MQSACQRRDKAKADVEAAERAVKGTKERQTACSGEFVHAKEALLAAEEEVLKASAAMAGPRPDGL
eukprot:2802721-Lingulodinium_polyedra.AAC.1